jgi:hypothetical protein
MSPAASFCFRKNEAKRRGELIPSPSLPEFIPEASRGEGSSNNELFGTLLNHLKSGQRPRV